VTSSARSPVTNPSANAERGSDYFATEAHYLSLARRLAAASGDRRLVLVTGDPPADPKLISEALRNVMQGHRVIIRIPCGDELKFERLLRIGCAELGEPVPPLFVFDEVDQLSDEQILQTCNAVAQRAGGRGAAILLARAAFPGRLEEPLLQRVKETLVARFRFDEIGEDESISFLRHQLETRHSDDEGRGIPPVIFRTSAAFALVAAIGIGAVVALHLIDIPRPTTATVATPPSPAAALPPPAAMTSMPAVATSPPAAAPPQRVSIPMPTATAMSPAAEPPPARDAVSPHSAPLVASPPASSPPAVARSPTAEIAALIARGDDFLKAGDIASARLYYERAADAGDGSAALKLGSTFDPGFLSSSGIRGTLGDPARAASWYARALDLGEASAAPRLKSLDHTAH
jgi:hypothetical protein